MKERLGILISGGGTTMAEIIKASKSKRLRMDIGCVIASHDNTVGIYKAQDLGIREQDIEVVDPKDFRGPDGFIDPNKFGEKLLSVLQSHGVTVVTQNGWLPKTPAMVINAFPNKIFNQHPGPVPEFGGKGMYGRRVHTAVLLFRRLTGSDNMWTEAVAQRASHEFDLGAVIKSKKVGILPTDTPDDLQKRVLPIEHELQIQLLSDFINGNIKEKPIPSVPLVWQHQKDTLHLAKKMACLLYPKG